MHILKRSSTNTLAKVSLSVRSSLLSLPSQSKEAPQPPIISSRSMSARAREAPPPRTLRDLLKSEPVFGSPPILLPLLSPPPDAKNAKPPLKEDPSNKGARDLFTISGQSWSSTNHIFPAAYPRSHPFATSPPADQFYTPAALPEDPAAAKAEETTRRSRAFEEWSRRTTKHNAEGFYPPTTQEEAEARAQALCQGEKLQAQLWCSVQRIVPSSAPANGVTLIFAHATSTHKEPTIFSMLQHLASTRDAPQVREIWSLDAADSGEAGSMNREVLGETVSWFDQARDIKTFIRTYLPPAHKSGDRIPLLLPRVSQSASESQQLVGIGHSFAGTSLAFLACDSPDLFKQIVLVDPGMAVEGLFELKDYIRSEDYPMSRGTIARKDVWSSKQAAHTYLASRPTFAKWDPEVLRLYVEHGLRPIDVANPSGPCTLSNSKFHEAATYAYSWQNRYAYDSVRYGSIRGGIHTITMSEKSFVIPSAEVGTKIREAAGQKGTSQIMEGSHLVVQEQPHSLGIVLANAIAQHYHHCRL